VFLNIDRPRYGEPRWNRLAADVDAADMDGVVGRR